MGDKVAGLPARLLPSLACLGPAALLSAFLAVAQTPPILPAEYPVPTELKADLQLTQGQAFTIGRLNTEFHQHTSAEQVRLQQLRVEFLKEVTVQESELLLKEARRIQDSLRKQWTLLRGPLAAVLTPEQRARLSRLKGAVREQARCTGLLPRSQPPLRGPALLESPLPTWPCGPWAADVQP